MKLLSLEEPQGLSRGEISRFLLLSGDPAHPDCVSLEAEVYSETSASYSVNILA